MSRHTEAKCKLCRRAGKKLFLKGERCSSPKCAIIKKPYFPGEHGKKGGALTQYGKQLAQKQTIKRTYGLWEKQFRRYFKKAESQQGKIADALIVQLETRLDNAVYRLGFAASRSQARQLVGHGFFLVNGKTVNIPSFQLDKGDEISFRESKKNKTYFKSITEQLKGKKLDLPTWLDVETKDVKGRVVSIPNEDDARLEADLQAIIEFYSR